MKKFLVIYHAPTPPEDAMQGNPEEMKKVMGEWMQWMEDCQGAVTDMGTPLGGGMSVTPSGSGASTKDVVGYSMMEADSMDAVIEMLKKHPHLTMPGGCTIEVHESLPVPGM